MPRDAASSSSLPRMNVPTPDSCRSGATASRISASPPQVVSSRPYPTTSPSGVRADHQSPGRPSPSVKVSTKAPSGAPPMTRALSASHTADSSWTQLRSPLASADISGHALFDEMDVVELDRLVVDTGLGWGDPAGELAVLVLRHHQVGDGSAVLRGREPVTDVLLVRRLVEHLAPGADAVAGIGAHLPVEALV